VQRCRWQLAAVAGCFLPSASLVKIGVLPVGVGLTASWVRGRDSRVVGRQSGQGEPKCCRSHYLSVRKIVPTLTSTSAEICLSMAGAK
jgi:hypothetical protein